jgi:mono/diheme cytochrome c family protein
MRRLIFLVLLVGGSGAAAAAEEDAAVQRGEYLLHLGGCVSCHTAEGGDRLAGGLKMETPYGDFYTPNITPDRETGIGDWSDADFIAAMTRGLAPDGSHYYPAFPYTSYTHMTRDDLIDLKRYLDAQPAVRQENRGHDLTFPFNTRSLMAAWKLLFFDPEPIRDDDEKDPLWNRGNYIVNGPGHCAECHTPRNLFGALDRERHLEGNPEGPEGEFVPGLHRGEGSNFRQWSQDDVLFLLQTGMLLDGDFVGGSMGKVIDNTTSRLTERDQKAIATYLAGEQTSP